MKLRHAIIPGLALLLSGCWYSTSPMPEAELDAIALGAHYRDTTGLGTDYFLTPAEGKRYNVVEKNAGEKDQYYTLAFDRLNNGVYLGEQHFDGEDYIYFLLKPMGKNWGQHLFECDADAKKIFGVTVKAEEDGCEFTDHTALRAAAVERALSPKTEYRTFHLQP